MPEIASGRHRIFYQEDGSGSPVLFGHSLTFDGDMFEAQVPELSKRHRCIRVDFRGHGRSSKIDEPYTLEDNAQDVFTLADALGIAGFHYVGLSMGGMTGMRMALMQPRRLRSLTLLDTSAAEEEPGNRAAYGKFAADSRDKPPVPAMAEMTLGLMFSPGFMKRDPQTVQRYRQKLLLNDVNAMSQTTLAVCNRGSVLERLGSIRTPSLVIVGSRDVATPPAKAGQIASAIPGARLETIPDAGHMTPVEEPELVTKLVSDFLKNVEGAPS